MSRLRRPIAKLYQTLSSVQRADLLSAAVKRTDRAEIAQLLRTCPRVSGSIRDPAFIVEAAARHSELILDLVGFNASAPPRRFDIHVTRLPATVDAARRIVEEFDARQKAS